MEKRNLISVVSMIALILFAQVLMATTYVVDQSGSGDYTDIQSAIDAATHGDIIIVKAGTYSAFNTNGLDNLTIQGSGADQTFVYNTGTGDAVTISGSPNTVFQGFTCSSSAGNGIYVNSSTGTTISNCTIRGCQDYGVLVLSHNDDDSIINCIITENNIGTHTAGTGGYGAHCALYVKNCIISNNTDRALWNGGSNDYNCYYNNGTNGNNGTLGAHDFVADPMFVSSSDLHLQSSSPCINAGTPSPMYNDLDGTRNDMGIYGGPSAYPGEGAKITSLVVSPTNVASSQKLTIIGTAKTR